VLLAHGSGTAPSRIKPTSNDFESAESPLAPNWVVSGLFPLFLSTTALVPPADHSFLLRSAHRLNNTTLAPPLFEGCGLFRPRWLFPSPLRSESPQPQNADYAIAAWLRERWLHVVARMRTVARTTARTTGVEREMGNTFGRICGVVEQEWRR